MTSQDEWPQRFDSPAWDPAVIARVTAAYQKVMNELHNLRTHRINADGSMRVPHDVRLGDVTGILEFGRVHVLDAAQRILDEAREVYRQTYTEIDEYKRGLYGPGYQPGRRG